MTWWWGPGAQALGRNWSLATATTAARGRKQGEAVGAAAGELVMDMGTVLDGRRAVKEKLIDELGGLSDALAWLYKEIERK